MYTAEQVTKAFELKSDEVNSYGENWDFDAINDLEFDENEFETIEINGKTLEVYYVASFGGEGLGDDAWIVFRIGDQLFKKSGWYSSHEGYEWDGRLFEVEEFQKTVTDYREKNDQ